MIANFGGALVEEFIDGPEYSVLISSNIKNVQDPISYTPVMCTFPNDCNWKTFQFKWQASQNPWTMVTDTALVKELQDISKQMYVAMQVEGFARTDIRMDAKTGKLYLLEINPNPSVFYPDDNGATADEILKLDGYGKKNFLTQLIEYGLKRHKKNTLNYNIWLETEKGCCIRATRDIKQGEVIIKYEEEPQRLVSLSHVKKHWNQTSKKFFRDYCCPITDELYVMWDVDPSNWKPINHSCDPNAWFEGLNLTASRDIQQGEEICVDYAILYARDEQGPSFTCKCGSSLCRGTWKGNDHLSDWFRHRYGFHVSDYVKQKMTYCANE